MNFAPSPHPHRDFRRFFHGQKNASLSAVVILLLLNLWGGAALPQLPPPLLLLLPPPPLPPRVLRPACRHCSASSSHNNASRNPDDPCSLPLHQKAHPSAPASDVSITCSRLRDPPRGLSLGAVLADFHSVHHALSPALAACLLTNYCPRTLASTWCRIRRRGWLSALENSAASWSQGCSSSCL